MFGPPRGELSLKTVHQRAEIVEIRQHEIRLFRSFRDIFRESKWNRNNYALFLILKFSIAEYF